MNNFIEIKNRRRRQARQARLLIVQALYQKDQSDFSLQEISSQFLENGGIEIGFHLQDLEEHEEKLIEKLDTTLFLSVITKIINMQNKIESLIQNTFTKGKSFKRLEILLQVILLAGTAEILMGKAPIPVIISEYLNISYGFFYNSEAMLINGVLDSVAKSISFIDKKIKNPSS